MVLIRDPGGAITGEPFWTVEEAVIATPELVSTVQVIFGILEEDQEHTTEGVCKSAPVASEVFAPWAATTSQFHAAKS